MKKISLLIYCALFSAAAFCQIDTRLSVTNDTTFNIADSNSLGPGVDFGNFISDGLVQKDGKIIILSAASIIYRENNNKVFRINADGSFDSAFKIGIPGVLDNPFNYGISSGVIQSDGKIVFAGSFGSYNGTTAYGIIRVNSDGTVDNTLQSGFGFDAAPSKVITQKDNKLIISGTFTTYNGTPATDGLIRLNTDGSVDTSFHYVHHLINITPRYYNVWQSIYLLPNGKILLAASKTVYKKDSLPGKIIRLNSDGTDDAAFNSIEDWTNSFVDLAVDSDTNIISWWGENVNPQGFSFVAYLKKYSSAGILDKSFDTTFKFDPNGRFALNHSIYFTNNKIIVLGNLGTDYIGNTVFVFDSNGVYNNTDTKILSGVDVRVSNYSAISSLLPSSNNKMIILGQFVKYNNTIVNRAAKINEDDFSLDGSYNLNTKGGANGDIYTQAILSNDKIFIGGAFTHYNGAEVNHIVKLSKDGVIDNSFHPSKGFNYNVYTICADNNKLVAGGDFTRINSDSLPGICRLNADGSVDNSFNVGVGFNDRVNVIVKQQDGKYLVGGNFTKYNNNSAGRLIRLNTDGSIDNTFNIGKGLDNEVKTICIQPDGKILIGGGFSNFNNSAVGSVVRLNADGSIDNLSQRFLGTVNAIVYQANDNKFIIGGKNLDGHSTGVFRCTNEGVIDTSLKSPYNANYSGTVNTIDILDNGLIVMGGSGEPIYDGDVQTQYHNLFVYLKDSELNATSRDSVSYYFDFYFLPTIYSINHQSDNKIIVAGMYGYYDTRVNIHNSYSYGFSFIRNNISRVILKQYDFNLPIKLLSFNAVAENNKSIKLYWTTATEINNKEFIVQRSSDGRSFDSIGVVNGAGNSTTLINYQYFDKNPLNGISYYKLRQVDFDGRYADSKIVSVNISISDEIKVYPTIFTTQLNISGNDANKIYTVSLTDLKGTNLGNFTGNINSINIKVNKIITRLSKGMYMLVFRTGNHLSKSYKILKE